MYLSTKSATTASGTVTSLDSTSDGTKGYHYIFAQCPLLLGMTTADFRPYIDTPRTIPLLSFRSPLPTVHNADRSMMLLSSLSFAALPLRLHRSAMRELLASLLLHLNTSKPMHPRAASPSTRTHSSQPSRWNMSLLGLKTIRPERRKGSTAMWDAWHSIQRSHCPSMAAPSRQARIKSHQEMEKLLESFPLLSIHLLHTTILYSH